MFTIKMKKTSMLSILLLTCSLGTAAAALASEASRAPQPDSIAVYSDHDRVLHSVRVSSVEAGDTVTVYDGEHEGRILGTSRVPSGEQSVDVEVSEKGRTASKVYVSVAQPGKAESTRTDKEAVAAFAPVMEAAEVNSSKAQAGDSVKVALDLAEDQAVSSVTLLYAVESKSGRLTEQQVVLVKNDVTGEYEGWFAADSLTRRGEWHVQQISFQSERGERFVISNAHEEQWVSGTTEHMNLEGMNITVQ
uniref:Uncharacterized protein n=2 Tax=Paenibacillus mucilaginosus K02 TaxID=997761 RepID=V9IRQ0_9BACL|nr:hypothetical protein [Paenibacillus mucilaginosus K02]